MNQFRVWLPVSFEAHFILKAGTAEEAAADAKRRYEGMSEAERISRIAGGMLVDFDGDGGVIGEATTLDEGAPTLPDNMYF